jgi:hypothetical protein
VERGVLGDPGVVDEDIDRTEVGFDLLDSGGAGIERTDIPFVDGNAGLGLELFCRRIIAGITGGNRVTGGFQPLADRRTYAPRSARYQCNSCHAESSLGFFVASN